jgi:hypothetical protein
VDQLQAYSPNVDQLYYTAHFIDGLRDDIKYFISIQLPKNLDTACCLTLLQEENYNTHGKGFKLGESNFQTKFTPRGA